MSVIKRGIAGRVRIEINAPDAAAVQVCLRLPQQLPSDPCAAAVLIHSKQRQNPVIPMCASLCQTVVDAVYLMKTFRAAPVSAGCRSHTQLMPEGCPQGRQVGKKAVSAFGIAHDDAHRLSAPFRCAGKCLLCQTALQIGALQLRQYPIIAQIDLMVNIYGVNFWCVYLICRFDLFGVCSNLGERDVHNSLFQRRISCVASVSLKSGVSGA